MLVRELRTRPLPWREYRKDVRVWGLPFRGLEWAFQWCAYWLSRWAFLEVLEYLSVLSVLFAVIFYFSESGDRRKQKHYQAWQVINTAQGKGGSGGRIEAMQELNADGVPLVGVNAAGAFLQGIQLPRANLLRADLGASDMRDSNLEGCDLEYAGLRYTNLRQSNLRSTNLRSADLEDADLVGAVLQGADLGEANLARADLRRADLGGVRWKQIKSVAGANLYGVRNAPEGFADWAMKHGAVAHADGE
ncbi:MAG TPA: pentapeptide repeat-containing protein [Bryobacteraceae bacterium]|nr:pentapeptide repeat-containing protein [Bryobacteraceae bacterium]